MVLVREKTYLMFDKNLVLCDIEMIDFIIISHSYPFNHIRHF